MNALFVLFNADSGQIIPNSTPWYQSSRLNFGRLAFAWSRAIQQQTVLRIGAGYYYSPGQTEDQVRRSIRIAPRA
jgi:hypothetical protein